MNDSSAEDNWVLAANILLSYHPVNCCEYFGVLYFLFQIRGNMTIRSEDKGDHDDSETNEFSESHLEHSGDEAFPDEVLSSDDLEIVSLLLDEWSECFGNQADLFGFYYRKS